MKFWWIVIGTFMAVFGAALLFMRANPVEFVQAEPHAATVPPQLDVPVLATDAAPLPTPAPRSAWEVQEDPIIRTRRIAGGMTLAAVKAHLRNSGDVQFRNLWVVDVLEGPVTASAVCGEVATSTRGEPLTFQAFFAAGTSLTLESEEGFQRLSDQFCAAERRIIPIRYGEFKDGGWKEY